MIAGIFSLFFMVLFGIIALAAFVFWIWMLIDAIQNKGLTDGEKVGWVLAVVFLHIIGALLYYFIGRPKSGRV
ncbi:MAG TPA: PLDc N-terminal domain-containing protein [Pseudomonadales bacterium]|nr:PLDc N-terminal domain-containing protein [Pseudomonadales bacterium]